MKVMFNQGINYQTSAYQTQGVTKCQIFKGVNLERARGLADLTMDELLAAERGGWENRRTEILCILTNIAQRRLGKIANDADCSAMRRALEDVNIGSLPKRIFEASKRLLTREG